IGAYWLSADQTTAGTGGVAGGTGIWFLQRAQDAWQVVPVVQGTIGFSNAYIPAQPGPIINAYAYSATASVQDKLASELCSAIEGVGDETMPIHSLLGGLDDLNSSAPRSLYRRLANASSTDQRVYGLSGLIRSGDSSALTAAAQIAYAVTGRRPEGVLLLSVREYLRPTDPASANAVG